MTRRCNLNCKFCSRGNQENIDMSKNIIDKTLDEVKNMYIHMLQIYGGEPTLVPELFDYLVNNIISKKIDIGYVIFFTNGLVQDNRIMSSLSKLLEYCKIITPNIRKYVDFYNKKSSKTYRYEDDKKIAVVVSSFLHNNKGYTDDAYNFYNQIKDENYKVVLQSSVLSNSFAGILLLEGKMQKNYYKMLPNVVSLFPSKYGIVQVQSTCNECYIIEDFRNEGFEKSIYSTICISANGNVYHKPGTSYPNVDKYSMFNIMKCNNDFFDKVELWCWEHPILPKINSLKEQCKTVKFCYEHNIKTVENIEEHYKESISRILPTITIMEKINLYLHKKYPQLSIIEIQDITNEIISNMKFNLGVL